MKILNLFVILIFTITSQYCSSNERKESMPSSPPSPAYSSPADISKTQKRESEKDQKKDNQPKQRIIIYEATVIIQAIDIEKRTRELIQIAEQFNGYALEYNLTGNLILKIPAANLQNFLAETRKTSEKYSEQMSARDVTEEFFDIGIRLENAKKVRERLVEILKVAKTVEEILKVEHEIATWSGTIESLEGRRKFLSENASYSKVTINIYKKYTPVIVKNESEWKPGPLGYPFYYLYKGAGFAWDGLIWLFIQNKPVEEEKEDKK